MPQKINVFKEFTTRVRTYELHGQGKVTKKLLEFKTNKQLTHSTKTISKKLRGSLNKKFSLRECRRKKKINVFKEFTLRERTYELRGQEKNIYRNSLQQALRTTLQKLSPKPVTSPLSKKFSLRGCSAKKSTFLKNWPPGKRPMSFVAKKRKKENV